MLKVKFKRFNKHKDRSVKINSMSTFLAYHMQYSRVKRGVYNRRSDISNFIGSDQKVTPSCCFLRDDAKNTNLSVFIQSPYARTILRN